MIFIISSANLGLRLWAALSILIILSYTLAARRVTRKKSRYHKLKRNGGRHTPYEWYMVQMRQGHRCACCQQLKELTKDHIIPVSKGGTDHISNIQALCQSCNSRKGTKIIRF